MLRAVRLVKGVDLFLGWENGLGSGGHKSVAGILRVIKRRCDRSWVAGREIMIRKFTMLD
jgi:hypothetical protein